MVRDTAKLCRRCGHPRFVHDHYRPGTECIMCDCHRFTRLPFPRRRTGPLLTMKRPAAVAGTAREEPGNGTTT